MQVMLDSQYSGRIIFFLEGGGGQWHCLEELIVSCR